jgi:hypothetical protein
VIARVNDPQPAASTCSGLADLSATQTIMALIEHEVPEHELIHLLELRKENLEIVEVQIDGDSPARRHAGRCLQMPRLTVMREGGAEICRRPSCGQAIRCSRFGRKEQALLRAAQVVTGRGRRRPPRKLPPACHRQR